MRMVRDFIFLEAFQTQLGDFLVANDLPTDLTTDVDQWTGFVRHYAGVIEDGSLICRAKEHGLKHVQQVMFTKGRDAVGGFAQIPFDMMWCISLSDGRSLDIQLNGRPAVDGVRPMISWGNSLRT